MTDLLSALIIPEEVRSYLAVIGLLLCWKLHALELRRRRAVTSQFFICLSENDPQTCSQCRIAHLHVYAGPMGGRSPYSLFESPRLPLCPHPDYKAVARGKAAAEAGEKK